MGIDASGTAVEWPNVSTFTVEDDRITEHWALSDALGFVRQVGTIPDPTAR